MAKKRNRRASSSQQTKPKPDPAASAARGADRQVEAREAEPLAPAVATPAAEPTSSNTMRNAGIAAFAALLAVQLVLLVTVLRTNSEVTDLRDEIEAGGLASGQLTDLGSGLSSPGPSTPAPSADSSGPVTGNLPRFLGGGADPAIGRNVGDLTSLEYYSGENTVLAATDGKSRAYMVWAHWCPFCQEELPVVADWLTENAAEFENFELVSVTTAMDETASNPLVPYLDDNQFPFPVLFDEDGSVARKLGVNAFPFWVFVAPDGTVVGRAAGSIGSENLATVFGQLNEMGASASSAMPAPN